MKLLIIINWLKRNRQNPSFFLKLVKKYGVSCLRNIPSQSLQNNDILLHYTEFARTANNISLPGKHKPIPIF